MKFEDAYKQVGRDSQAAVIKTHLHPMGVCRLEAVKECWCCNVIIGKSSQPTGRSSTPVPLLKTKSGTEFMI